MASTATKARRSPASPPASSRGWLWWVAIPVLILAVLIVASQTGGDEAAVAGGDPATGGGGKFPYQVGEPGPGEKAPETVLETTDGDTFDLAGRRGETVLLYFQEGLMCQPCWDQLRDIEANRAAFDQFGIDTIATISHDPVGALGQKADDEGLTSIVASDPGLEVSKTYSANQYGMMRASANGHSFVVVDEQGDIAWRADYGGAPNYTMYLPVPDLLADMQAGLGSDSEAAS